MQTHCSRLIVLSLAFKLKFIRSVQSCGEIGEPKDFAHAGGFGLVEMGPAPVDLEALFLGLTGGRAGDGP